MVDRYKSSSDNRFYLVTELILLETLGTGKL